MPWTRRAVKYLLSSGSPLSEKQKTKMKGELHVDPSMGHAKKGSAELRKGMSGSVSNYKFHRPKRKLLKRHFPNG